MNMNKLAKLLHVDEVVIEHGHRGYAVSVRLEKEWLSSTLDHDDLAKGEHHARPKMHGVAEKLVFLSDTLIHGVSRNTIAKNVPLPVRQAEPQRQLAGAGVRYQPTETFEGRQLSLYYWDAPPAANQPLPPATMEPAASVSLPSRFHAIVAELSKP
jgi:hypothetical protein